MTIAELKTKPVELGKHLFRLRTPKGIEFITSHEDIKKSVHTVVDFSGCEVIGEPMNYAEAKAWADAHPLSPQQVANLSAELEEPKIAQG